jgi:hypothetical protein
LQGIPEEDADRADGIGAVVPGVAVFSSFEPGPTPVAVALADLVEHLERFDRFRRMRLAAIDTLVAPKADAMVDGFFNRKSARIGATVRLRPKREA